MTVYAKRDCQDGFTMNTANGECETDQHIFVTFVADPSTFPE